jgi:hypothetical protein
MSRTLIRLRWTGCWWGDAPGAGSAHPPSGDLLAAPPAPEVVALDIGQMPDDAQQARTAARVTAGIITDGDEMDVAITGRRDKPQQVTHNLAVRLARHERCVTELVDKHGVVKIARQRPITPEALIVREDPAQVALVSAPDRDIAHGGSVEPRAPRLPPTWTGPLARIRRLPGKRAQPGPWPDSAQDESPAARPGCGAIFGARPASAGVHDAASRIAL